MSGIVGIHHTDGRPVDAPSLNRMTDTLAHRGPDGRGVWRDGAVGLGHRMFHETPESLLEQQPCLDPAAQLALVADARIDNRSELIRQLGFDSWNPGLLSDSRLILASYDEWGEDCVDHLLGDFAFALWDTRHHTLFCARDYIGVKPFYYSFSGGNFVFASEQKAILRLDDAPRPLDEESVASYLATDDQDREATIYRGLRRLPPAHTLRVDRDGCHTRCYWQPDPERELRLGSDAEYAEAFRDVFAESVRARLRSVSPVGSMLSGGMDSSSVTCVARDLLAAEGRGRSLRTFSATYDHLPRVDERRYQDTVIAAGAIEPHRVPMAGLGPLEAYIEGQRSTEFPFVGWAYYIHRALHEQARSQGVRVLLEGFGGDDVVNHGIPYLQELLRRFHWVRFFNESRALARTHGVTARRVLWHYGIRPAVPQPLRSLWRFARHGFAQEQTSPLGDVPIAPGLLHRTGVLERLRTQATVDSHKPLTLRQGHALGFTSGLVASCLEILDQWSADHSIVTRHPFYDRRLVEFCLSLPHHQKMSGGWTRVVLRRAMQGVLPPENQWRPDKSDNSPHLFQMMRGRESSLLMATLDRVSGALAPYADIDRLRRQCQAFLSGERSDTLGRTIWPAISLGVFLQDCRPS